WSASLKCSKYSIPSLSFFFQAEDGIRDRNVTGVQTCALPISQLRLPRVLLAFAAGAALSVSGVLMQGLLRNPLVSAFTLGVSPRSEERRVGKECRSR